MKKSFKNSSRGFISHIKRLWAVSSGNTKQKSQAYLTLRAEKLRGGFTLIEILIVVAIIAVIASSVLVGFGPAQRQSRDTRRIADLRQVQNALGLYFAKCGYYPGGNVSGGCTTFGSAPADWAALTSVLTGSTLGITQVPTDPTSGKNYHYGSSDGTGYTLGADLEDPNNPALKNSAPSSNTVTCKDSTYCIQF